jgi:hypothetical protein
MSADDRGSAVVDLEQRVRLLEDRLDIEELVMRYFLAIDSMDMPALAATFAVDARFGEQTGREAIVEFQGASRRTMGVTIHTPHHVDLAFEGRDRAAGAVGAHCELERDGICLVGALRYNDSYIRSPGGWVFAARDVEYYFLCPWDEVDTSLTAAQRVRWPGGQPRAATLPRFQSGAR